MIKKVNISVNTALLDRVDQYARENYTSRSAIFAQGASMFILQGEMTNAVKNMTAAMQRIAESGTISEDDKKRLDDFVRLSSLLTR